MDSETDAELVLAQQFEEHRPHLRAVALRMLGTTGEADDAVQEAWLRLSRSDTSDVANLGGWLTTVVARVCLDLLRSRTARREQTTTDVLERVQDPTDAGAPRGRGGARRQRRGRAGRGAGDAGAGRAAGVRAARPVRGAVRRGRRDPRPDARPRPGSSPAGRGGGSAPPARRSARSARRSARWWTRSSPPPASGDLAGLVALLHPDAAVRADGAAVRDGRRARGRRGRRGGRDVPRAGPARPGRARSTASRRRCGRSAAPRRWSSGSPSRTAWCARSSCSPTRRCSPGWTSRPRSRAGPSLQFGA